MAVMNSDGTPQILGEVYQQSGAVAMATRDDNGALTWTVLSCNGSSVNTSTLAHTTCWQRVDRGLLE